MEVRSQDKQIGIPSYNSAVAERRGEHHRPVHGDSVVFQPHQTLDHHHHHHPNLLSHDQLQYQRHDKPRRDPDPGPDIDPDRAPTSSPTSSRSNQDSPPREPQKVTQPTPTSAAIDSAAPVVVRYRECQKNHAASMGGHVVDGCGEFMPGGEEGTLEALKCAACDCHRNFHRKEIDGESPYNPANCTSRTIPPPPHLQPHQLPPHHHYHHRHHHRLISQGLLPSPSLLGPFPPMMMNFGNGGGGGTAAESSSEDLNMFQSNNNKVGQTSGQLKPSKKRFRTKFSQEQKEKMLEFAEKVGWKIQKQDEKEVQQFCSQLNVTRQVFKVWMHNNKQVVLKKKQIT